MDDETQEGTYEPPTLTHLGSVGDVYATTFTLS
jgi:hypothetical protein